MTDTMGKSSEAVFAADDADGSEGHLRLISRNGLFFLDAPVASAEHGGGTRRYDRCRR